MTRIGGWGRGICGSLSAFEVFELHNSGRIYPVIKSGQLLMFLEKHYADSLPVISGMDSPARIFNVNIFTALTLSEPAKESERAKFFFDHLEKIARSRIRKIN